MKCSVLNCNNERERFQSFGNDYSIIWITSEFCKSCRESSPLDDVLVSEWEAYTAWIYCTEEGYDLYLGCVCAINVFDNHDEIISALFGYWNEKVRL